MKDRRPLIVFAIFLLAMTGIVLATRHHPPANATDNPSSTGETTTTTTLSNNATSTTLTGSSTTPTTIANAGPDQWRSIFDYTVAVQNALFQNPDPSKVDLIMDPSCSCYSETRTGLQSMADKKWHVQGDTLATDSVALITKSDTQLRIAVTFVGTTSPTVDQNGTVKEKGTPGLRDPILYVLKKNTSGKWLIVDRHTYEEG